MKMTISTMLTAGLVVISLLSTAPLTSADTHNPADQPDTQIAEEPHENLDTSDAPVDADQPTEALKDTAAERYRRVLEELRLPDVEDLQDGSTSQAERQ